MAGSLLKCMNCQKELQPNGGEFFMEVFICSSCKLIAERLYERAQQDVKHLLVMMKEAIRLGLVQGQLQFRDPEQVEEVTRPNLLNKLAELAEQAREQQAAPKDEVCHDQTQPESSPNMKPHVATLAAIGSSSSSKLNPADSKSETLSSETPATPSSDSAGNANDTAR